MSSKLKRARKAAEIHYPMVAVVWVDPSQLHDGGWAPRDKSPLFALARCVSVGLLRQQTKKRVVLALSVNAEGMQGVPVIPTEAIKAIYTLEVKW